MAAVVQGMWSCKVRDVALYLMEYDSVAISVVVWECGCHRVLGWRRVVEAGGEGHTGWTRMRSGRNTLSRFVRENTWRREMRETHLGHGVTGRATDKASSHALTT